LTLVGTDELFLREEIEKAVRSVFGERGPGPGLLDHPCKPRPGDEAVDPRTLLDEIRTPSLFGGAKLVVLRDVDGLADADRERLVEVARNPAPGIRVVLCFASLRRGTKLEKALEASGEVRRFRPLYDRPGPWESGRAEHDSELTRWLVARAAARRLRLAPTDAYRIIRRVGNHPVRLDAEIEKLSLLLGPDASAGPDDVDALVSGGGEYRAFDLADAVAERDARRALRVVGSILQEGVVGGGDASKVQSLYGIFPMIVGALRSKLAELLRVRSLLDSGHAPSEVRERMRAPEFLKNQFLAQARLHTASGLERRLEQLLRFDLDVKRGAQFPEAALERLVVTLTRPAAEGEAERKIARG